MDRKIYPVVPEDQDRGAEIRCRFVNLTPHVVRLLARKPGGGFTLLADLAPSGHVARVEMALAQSLDWRQMDSAMHYLRGTGFQVRGPSTPGRVFNLPPPQARTEYVPTGSSSGARMEVVAQSQPQYVVSTMVAQALRGHGRRDVYSPGTGPEDVERGPDGQIYGVYALEQAPR